MMFQSKSFGLVAGLVTGLCISAGVGILPAVMVSATQERDAVSAEQSLPENTGAVYGVPEFSEEFIAEHMNYKVNDNGLTYGTAFFAETVEEEPDLIAVTGDNDIEGYVYKKDLEEESPSSPEEAVRMEEEIGYPFRTLTVYESDGVTAIGTFTVGGIASSEKPNW